MSEQNSDTSKSDQEKPEKKGGATFGGWKEPSGLDPEEWTIVLMPKGSTLPTEEESGLG
jgi:hypothetical protein